MNPKKTSKPQALRGTLATLLILIIASGAASFYFGLDFLKEYSTDVNHRLADAEASGRQIEELQALRSQLDTSDSLILKANQIFSTPQNYQSKALADVNNYADATGLSIASTSFGNPSRGDGYTITVTFSQPVDYKKFIHFLENIESNLPKMQVSSITLGNTGGGANSLKTGEVIINVSAR